MAHAAGIVLYNPDIKRLEENISAIAPQVSELILIDNGSKNIDEIAELTAKYDNITYVRNDDNYGIAKALNQIIDKADELGEEWVLTLDQDTVCEPDIIETYDRFAKRAKDNIGIITSKYKDRSVEVDFGMTQEYEKVSFCITSGAFNNVKCIKAVGGFDEKLFIDMVDYDKERMQDNKTQLYRLPPRSRKKHFKKILRKKYHHLQPLPSQKILLGAQQHLPETQVQAGYQV